MNRTYRLHRYAQPMNQFLPSSCPRNKKKGIKMNKILLFSPFIPNSFTIKFRTYTNGNKMTESFTKDRKRVNTYFFCYENTFHTGKISTTQFILINDITNQREWKIC